MRTESWPLRPSNSSPPAISTSSGFQWPEQYGGSIHSRRTHLGLRTALSAADLTASTRSANDLTTLLAEYSSDTEDVFEDVLQAGRLEIDHLWRSREGGGESRHRLVAHGADIAQLLSQ